MLELYQDLGANMLKKPSEGYFLAKREMQDSLAGRINILTEKMKALKNQQSPPQQEITSLKNEIEVLEKTRSHLRNSLLWNKENGE